MGHFETMVRHLEARAFMSASSADNPWPIEINAPVTGLNLAFQKVDVTMAEARELRDQHRDAAAIAFLMAVAQAAAVSKTGRSHSQRVITQIRKVLDSLERSIAG